MINDLAKFRQLSADELVPNHIFGSAGVKEEEMNFTYRDGG